MKDSFLPFVLPGLILSGAVCWSEPVSRTEWMGAYLNSHKVGWSSLSIGSRGDYPDDLKAAALEQGFEDALEAGVLLFLSQSSIEVLAYGGVNLLEWSTLAALHPDLTVDRFHFQLNGDDSSISLSGRAGEEALHLTVHSANSVDQQVVPLSEGGVHLAESVPLLLAERLRRGLPLDGEVQVFEPHQMVRSTWKVRLEETETWDLPNGRREILRVRQDIGGFSPLLWMTREGEVHKEWAPFSEDLGYLSFKETEQDAKSRDFQHPSLLASLTPTQSADHRPDLLLATAVRVPDRLSRSRDVSRMVIDLWDFDLSRPIPEGRWQTNLSRYPDHEPTAALPLRLEIRSPDPDSLDLPERPLHLARLSDSIRPLLEAEPLVQSEHPEIRRISHEIVDGLEGPWEKAVAIFDWIAENIQTEFRITLPSAIEVLETRKGDCNEQSTLFAALARSAGVPTKICTGLVYQNDGFYYHAWNEVLASSSPEIWIPIDPALKQTRVDATHIKFGEGGLSEQTYLTGMIGRIRARIVELDKDDTNRESDQTVRNQDSG